MTGSALRVSVVIPCYNAARFLRETLGSVLAQSVQPFEVLVIDDGSSDDSVRVAESYGPRVRLIQQEHQGESLARNRGIDEARGDWIAFLDADDLWESGKIERQLEAVRDGVVCIHTNYRFFGGKTTVRDLSKIPARRRYSLEYFLLGKTTLATSTVMVPRRLAVRFPVWTQYAEDTIYFAELSRLGDIVLVPEILTAIRSHASSQSAARGIRARWHASFEEWLQRDKRNFAEPELRAIRQQMLERLTYQAHKAFWQKDFAEFEALRTCLQQYADNPIVKPLFLGTITPKWKYKLRRVARRGYYSLADGVKRWQTPM